MTVRYCLKKLFEFIQKYGDNILIYLVSANFYYVLMYPNVNPGPEKLRPVADNQYVTLEIPIGP